MQVYETEAFSKWVESLKDEGARRKIATRIDRLAFGNPGDVKPVGNGISEMRVHYYFVQHGSALAMLLGGGDKSTQERDIAAAKKPAEELEW